LENPIHEYDEDGTYDVELLAINECDTAVHGLSMDIYTLPTAGFSAAVTEGCADLIVEFENSSTENALDFQWFFPGAEPEISFEKNPEVIYFVPGLHTVTLIVSNPSGADTLMIEEFINIYPSPQPYFDYGVDSLTISFEDLSNHVDRYYWDFGDGQFDTTAQPVHTYAVDSSYEVTLMGMNECDTVWMTRRVATGGLPQTNFSVLGERLGCVPFSIELRNESEGNVEEYQWLFPGGSPDSSAAVNPSVTYDSTGIYSITLIAYNSNGSNQFTLQNAVRVIDLPSAEFSFAAQTDFTYAFESAIEGEEITDIQWFFGDGNTSNESDPVHTYEAEGEYEAMLVVSNLCGRDTATQVIQIQTTSVTSFEEQSILVYPNPAHDRVFISPWPAEAQIQIHNNLGAVEQLAPSRSDQFISVNHLPAGMYFLHIIRDQDRIVAPLIIQR
jgi:PKD repeat protein